MKYKTIKGYLSLELGSEKDIEHIHVCEEEYLFTTQAGNVLKVCFASEKQAEATPLNTLIILSLGCEDGEIYHVSPSLPWFTKVDTEAPAPTTTMNVAIFKTIREADLPDKEEDELVKVTGAARVVERKLRQIAGRFWNVDVRGFVLPLQEGEAPPDRSQWCEAAIARYMKAHPEQFEDFEPTKCHLWGNVSGSYCGWGQVGGKYSMTFSACGTRTMLHELGHNFGLRHSNSGGAEYGDTSCYMGRGYVGYNSPQQKKLQIDTEREAIYVNKSVELLLMPISYSQDDLVARAYQHVIVPRGSRKYFLSTYAGGAYVSIHLDGSKTDRLHQLKAGSEQQVEDFTVQVLEKKHGMYKIRILLPDGIEPVPVEIPETLPAAQEGTYISPSHHGTWWDPMMYGQGFDIQYGKYFFWYTFDEKKHTGQSFTARRFYLGVLGDSVEEFPIYTTEKGTLEDPSIREETLVGYGQLSFYDEDSGLFRYRFAPENNWVDRGSIRLERLSWTNKEESGTFWEPSRAGEGVTVQFVDDRMVAFWYTYGPPDTDHIGRIIKANTTQRWYIMTGDRDDLGDTWRVNIQEMQGGYLAEQVKASAHDVGKGRMKWNNGVWTFDYNISQNNSPKTGTLNLQKLP